MVKFPAVFKNRKFITLLTTAPPVVPIPYQINSVAAHSPQFFQNNSGTALTIRVLNPGRGKKFICYPAQASRPTLGPIQPRIQWVTGLFQRGDDSAKREANTHLQLLPKLRNSGAISPLHHMPG